MQDSELTRDLLRRCALNFPTKIAYIDGDRKLTWAEAYDRASRFASVLRSRGIEKGDAVAIISNEHLEVCDHIFACLMIGAVRVGINTRFSEKEILHVINDSNTKLVLVDSHCSEKIEGLTEQLKSDGVLIIGYGGDHSFPLDFDTCMRESQPVSELPEIFENDLAFISYTSGTTGLPKGVMISQKAIHSTIIHTVLGKGLQHDDVAFNALANAWITVILTIYNVANGMTVVLPNGSFGYKSFSSFCRKV